MYIIKLNAIESTNGYLKELTAKKKLENFTVVVAEQQTKGRGQMGTVWLSEEGKNLTFSLLVNFDDFNISNQFYLSMAVSLGVLTTLKSLTNTSFYIKWPNDILAEKDKIAGILIENIIGGHLIKQSIIGIGLNVNQVAFCNTIKDVTSLKNISGKFTDKEMLLKKIVLEIKHFVNYINKREFKQLKKMYLMRLFKLNMPSMFIDKDEKLFLGKIIDVSNDGKLVVELEDETTRKFSLKEIKFASR